MSTYYGDFLAGATVRIGCNTVSAAGVPTAVSSGTVAIRKDGADVTPSGGVAFTAGVDSNAGQNELVVTMSADATTFAAGHEYKAYFSGTSNVGGTSIVGIYIGEWSVQNRSLVTDAGGYANISLAQALPANPAANTVGEALFIADILGGRVSTAKAGGSSTITLDAGASADSTSYVGDAIYLYGGTGGGARGSGQWRSVVAYNGSTKVAAVNRPWLTTPDATSKFITLPQAVANVGLWGAAPVPAPAAAGIPDVNVKNIAGAASAGAAGYVGPDWSHVNAPTSTVGLSATSIGDTRLANLDAAVSSRSTYAGGAVASVAGNVGGNVVGSVGSVANAPTNWPAMAIASDGTVRLAGTPRKNAALPGFQFFMPLAGTNTGAAGRTVVATRSLDGSSFAGCANAATELGLGWYTINLAAADMNGTTVALQFAAAGCDAALFNLLTIS